jgi:hypothetical protein
MKILGDILFHILAIIGFFTIVFWLVRFLPRKKGGEKWDPKKVKRGIPSDWKYDKSDYWDPKKVKRGKPLIL